MLSGLAGVIAGLALLCLGCGNSYRPVEYPIAPTAGNPKLARFALVVYQGEVPSGSPSIPPSTCVNGYSVPCIGATSEIDVSGDAIVTNVYVGHTPVQAVLSSQVVVSNQGDDSVSLFGLTTGTPSAGGTISTAVSLPAGSAPTALAAANGLVYVADSGTTFTNASPPQLIIATAPTIAVVSPSSNTVLATLNLQNGGACATCSPIGLAATPDGTKVYVANNDISSSGNNHSVTVISTADNTISSTIALALTVSPAAIVADSSGTCVYVLSGGSDPSITIIDVLSDTVVSSNKIHLPSGGNSNSMTFDPQLRRLYVTNPGTSSLSVFDATNPEAPTLVGGNPVTVGSGPCAVAVLPDGSSAYVVLGGAIGNQCSGTSNPGQVAVINASSNTVSTTITVGDGPVAIAASGDGSRVYVPYQGIPGQLAANGVTKGVTVISVSSNLISASSNQVVTYLGAPFADPACESENGPNPCNGLNRLNPVFIVSQ